MLLSWRWFGPDDPVSLAHIRQAGAQGIVTALHDIPPGTVWPLDAIQARKSQIQRAGDEHHPLHWAVVESIPVHRSIQTGATEREAHIDSFRQSLRNVAESGLATVCYNFMPVLDWSRTDVAYQLSNGARALRFQRAAMVAFDVHILERKGARHDYDEQTLRQASDIHRSMTSAARASLTSTILAGLPGSDRSFTLAEFRAAVEEFRNIGAEELRDNLIHFHSTVVPTAEELGVRLAIHPDDPPFPILGIPRVVSTQKDLATIFSSNTAIANGLTLCTGSLGAHPGNNVNEILREHAARIHFLHLRNVRREAAETFYESDHLDGEVDIFEVVRGVVDEEDRRRTSGSSDHQIPMRPDHGHLMLDDLSRNANPGYSAIGRLKGLAELRGLEMGIRRSKSDFAPRGAS